MLITNLLSESTLDILDTDLADAKAIKHLESLSLAVCERASDKPNPDSTWTLTAAGSDSWRLAFAVHSGKSLKHCMVSTKAALMTAVICLDTLLEGKWKPLVVQSVSSKASKDLKTKGSGPQQFWLDGEQVWKI